MKIMLEVVYSISSYEVIDLPDGKTWDDVAEWHVTWSDLYLKFKGSDEYLEFDTGEASLDSVDWKRPDCVRVFETDENGDPDYDKCLAEAKGVI